MSIVEQLVEIIENSDKEKLAEFFKSLTKSKCKELKPELQKMITRQSFGVWIQTTNYFAS